MEDSLFQHIQKKLPNLFKELGFRVIWQAETEVELGSEGLRLLFVRDMGICVQVAPPTPPDTSSEPEARYGLYWVNDWIGLSWILEVIRGEPTDTFLGCGPDLEPLGALVRDNLPALVEALGPNLSETKLQLQRIRESRNARPLPKPVVPVYTGLSRWRIVTALPPRRIRRPIYVLLVVILVLWVISR
jgi:hypothetical protein